MKKESANGFTLIELLVVIAIIASIIAVAVPNFLSARDRAKDSKRKSELAQMKSALRLYYNDYKNYPPGDNSAPGGTPGLNVLLGCGATGQSVCPVCSSADFAAGGTDGCAVAYMKQLPRASLFYYGQCPGGDDFRVKTTLDNKSDTDAQNSQRRCPLGCGFISYMASDYVVCAD